MTKNEIINAVSDRTGIHKRAVELIFNDSLEVMADALARKESVYLRGFWTFDVVKRKARKARDIKQGTTIEIPEQSAVKFKLSKAVKDAMNK